MNRKWQISKSVISSKIDEEVILMSVEQDAYFGIDPIGSHIWELLSNKPASINDLVAILMEEYEVEEETCKQDVLAFINEMSTRKLIAQID